MLEWLFGWLEAFKDWIIDLIKWVLGFWFDQILSAILWVVQQVPVPDEFQNANIGSYLDPDILWMLNQSGVADAFAIITVAIVFRTLRQILTLGIWG